MKLQNSDINAPSHAPADVQTRIEEDTLVVSFSGTWAIGASLVDPETLSNFFSPSGGASSLAFDTDALAEWDSRFMVFCGRLIAMAEAANMAVDRQGLPEGASRLLVLSKKVPPREGAARTGKAKESFAARVGGSVLESLDTAKSVTGFLGDVTLSLGRFFSGKAVLRKEDLLAQIKVCGSDSIGIVSLISMLVGLILAYVGAVQLKAFGAQVYTSTLVGIAMVRVLSAVMTAIIMAGRTGAAFAAELGTMQVNEEIDALQTFGINPLDLLVLPRVIAMTIMMPLLCAYADIMGVIGGAIVGIFFLDINATQYIQFTMNTVPLVNVWIGLVHSFVFGILVAMAGCYQGMQCGRSALAVGNATTSAVVSSIISIILATSLLTVMCNVLGI